MLAMPIPPTPTATPPRAEEQAGERRPRLGPGGQHLGRQADLDSLGQGRVRGKGQHRGHRLDLVRLGPQVDLGGVAAQAELGVRDRETDQGGLVDLRGERDRTQDADHREVLAAQVHQGAGRHPGDAQRPGGDRAEHDRGVVDGGRVQEGAAGDRAAQGVQQAGLRGQHRDAAAVHGGDRGGPPDQHAGHVAHRGDGLDRWDPGDHAGCGGGQRSRCPGDVLPGGHGEQVAFRAQLAEQGGPGRGGHAEHRHARRRCRSRSRARTVRPARSATAVTRRRCGARRPDGAGTGARPGPPRRAVTAGVTGRSTARVMAAPGRSGRRASAPGGAWRRRSRRRG